MAPEDIDQEPIDTEGGAPAQQSPQWTATSTRRTDGTIPVETGRNQTASAQIGAPFAETIDRIANEANYGGYYRVFLNGHEILEPHDAPQLIEDGQRIAITAYDKVG